MVIPETNHSQEIFDRHMRKVQLRNTNHARQREASNKVLELLAADSAINDLDGLLKIVEEKRNRGIRAGNPGTSLYYPFLILKIQAQSRM